MSLFGLLVAALIAIFMVFAGFKGYFKAPEAKVNHQIKEVSQEEGVDISSHDTVLSHVEAQLKTASYQEAGRVQEMEDLR